jgi:hypothetical protein
MSDLKRIAVLATNDEIAWKFLKAIGANSQNLPFFISRSKLEGGQLTTIQFIGKTMEDMKGLEVACYDFFRATM